MATVFALTTNEEIGIHPPTELVPDSYNQEVEKMKTYICVFRTNKNIDSDIDTLIETLKECGYLNPERKDFAKKDELQKFNDDMAKETFSEGVLMFWFGKTSPDSIDFNFKLSTDDITIRELWLPIVENSSLQQKPKIIMFFPYVPKKTSGMEVDAGPFPRAVNEYESPLEADVLLVMQTTDENELNQRGPNKTTYVQELSSKIKELRDIHHLANIVCLPEMYTPITISTLTRKFYLPKGQHRGLNFQLDRAIKELKELVHSSIPI